MGSAQETSKKNVWGLRYKDQPLSTSEDVKWKSKFLGYKLSGYLNDFPFLVVFLNKSVSGSGWGERHTLQTFLFFCSTLRQFHHPWNNCKLQNASRAISSLNWSWQLSVVVKGTSWFSKHHVSFCVKTSSRPIHNCSPHLVTHALCNVVALCWPTMQRRKCGRTSGARWGHVYLTPWPVSQSAVRPLLTADRGVICRVTGAPVWRAARI